MDRFVKLNRKPQSGEIEFTLSRLKNLLATVNSFSDKS